MKMSGPKYLRCASANIGNVGIILKLDSGMQKITRCFLYHPVEDVDASKQANSVDRF